MTATTGTPDPATAQRSDEQRSTGADPGAAYPSLLGAMLAMRKAVPTLPKDKVNPHFGSRFTALETIVETLDPILSEYGLLWTTFPGRDAQGNPELIYQLVHVATGESITGYMPLLLSKGDMQGLGSAITYARRYALSAVLNLVADEDDDGEAASDQAQSGGAETGGDTVNLQQDAKGLRNEAINAAFAKAGLPAQDKPWGPLGRVPADRADTLREALAQQRAMA